MATFTQVLKSTSQGRRQLWYVCGSEPALVQDAYELAQEHVNSLNLDVSKRVFFGEDVSLFELQSELSRDLDEDRQMVVLLNANKFQEWAALAPVLREGGKERFFIALADTPPDDEVRSLFINSAKARYVVCDTLSEDDQLTWINSRLSITLSAARLLRLRAQGDHDWLLNQVRKLEALPGKQVEESLVKTLCTSPSHPDFVTSLVERNRVASLAAVEWSVPSPGDVRQLREALLYLGLIQGAKERAGHSQRLLGDLTGLTAREISVFHSNALHYDSKPSLRRHTAMVKLYDGLMRGSRQAFFALVTRW